MKRVRLCISKRQRDRLSFRLVVQQLSGVFYFVLVHCNKHDLNVLLAHGREGLDVDQELLLWL